MPWRLIFYIAVFTVFLTFITFNLENRCDINFWFNSVKISDVPVFMTIFSSFIIGLICALPIALRLTKKSKDTPVKKDQGGNKSDYN